MTWKSFAKKMPLLGSNIVIKTEEGMIGIVQFNLDVRHFIKFSLENNACDGNKDAYCIDFYSDYPEEDDYIAVENAVSWMYPSELAETCG